MIRVRFLRTFDETLKAPPAKEQARAQSAVNSLLGYFGGGPKPIGLGLRKLKGNYWEIRAGLGKRIFLSLEGELATFILIGSHDEVRRLLHRR